MAPKQTVINIDDDKLKSILSKLEARIPPKPKEGMTLREIIQKSRPVINKALKRGYTYDEIVAILTEEGINIKAVTLKQYLAESTKTKRRKVEPSPALTAEPSTQTADKKLDTLPEIKASVEASVKTDAKPDVKTGSKPKSVVRGKFADIPSNEEL